MDADIGRRGCKEGPSRDRNEIVSKEQTATGTHTGCEAPLQTPSVFIFRQDSKFMYHKPFVNKLTPPRQWKMVIIFCVRNISRRICFPPEISAWIVVSCYLCVGKGLQST